MSDIAMYGVQWVGEDLKGALAADDAGDDKVRRRDAGGGHGQRQSPGWQRAVRMGDVGRVLQPVPRRRLAHQ